MELATHPGNGAVKLRDRGVADADGAASRRQRFRVVSLKDERLTRKVTLAFGFMSFIPLLLVFSSFLFIRPAIRGPMEELLRLFILGIIVSVFVGYFVLKRTIGEVIRVIQHARTVAQSQLADLPETVEGDEVGELARTFNRITHELEHKIDELESSRALIKRLLLRIGNAIASNEGIQHLLDLIVENASTALEAQLGSLVLVDGEKQALEIKSSWSESGQHTTIEMRFGEGMAGWGAREGKPMRGTSSTAAVGLSSEQVKDGAILCVPLILREKTIGVISMLRADVKRPFSEDDELVVSNIGAQIAVAIENYRLNLDVEHTYLETISALALAVEAKEPHTAGHSKRVGFYSVKIAEVMGVDEETKKIINHAGLLHDIGKIGIKDEILLKAAPLTPEEWRMMQQHSVIGEAILKPVRSLAQMAELVRCHHERYDGTGYPSGLKGEQIPLAARILTVADSYDAMASDRPYRKRLTLEESKDELRRGSGTQFDPQVVEAFLKVLDEKERRQSHAQSDWH